MGGMGALVRIANRCQESWDVMAGDERVRFCGVCSQSVYNLSEMPEAEALVAAGGACTRVFRRMDGSVVTRDCQASERPRFLVNVAYMAASLALPVVAQVTPPPAEVRGTVIDWQKAPMEDVLVRLEQAKARYEVRSAKDGTFVTKDLKPGSYHVMGIVDGEELAHSQLMVVASKKAELSLRMTGTIEVGQGAALVVPESVSLKDRKLDVK